MILYHILPYVKIEIYTFSKWQDDIVKIYIVPITPINIKRHVLILGESVVY